MYRRIYTLGDVNLDNKVMQLQQYIDFHHVLQLDSKQRNIYLGVINYLCKQVKQYNQWTKSMMMFMKERMSEGHDLFRVYIDSNNVVRYKKWNKTFRAQDFYEYRFNILTDCLFLTSFEDRSYGKIILYKLIKLFPSSRKELESLFENFFEVDLGFIAKYFPTMLEIYRIIHRNREFLAKPLKRIMVTGNMSAGKSTLLNALAGKKINKTQNDTCTAKVHYMYNKAGEDNVSYELDYELVVNASSKLLLEDNENNESPEIFVGTRFRSINEIDRRVCIIDTPGVNSCLNKEHRAISDDVIVDENCDLLLFLLNGENIGTDDDKRHLKNVREMYKGDIIFLINKLDRYKQGIDSISNAIHKVKDDLEKYGYEKPKVFPISAYSAYLAKMSSFNEALNEDELHEIEYRKRKLSQEEFRYDKYYSVESQIIYDKNENHELLRNSGLIALEQLIY